MEELWSNGSNKTENCDPYGFCFNKQNKNYCLLLLNANIIIGSRVPLSSKQPLLSLSVSVCLSVRLSVVVWCPRPFTHFWLTNLDETWQLGPTLAQTRCFEVSCTCAP